MAFKADEIRLVHRVIGAKHVFTSPDVPELHVSHVDEATARGDVQPVLDAIERTKTRVQGQRAHRKMLETV